jgi:nitrate/nitrite-specific signal transduction histidine kinase
MPLYSFWSQPICGWSFDDFQSFRDRLGSTSFDQYVRNYKNSFDDKNIAPTNLGLTIIRERAKFIGASVQINSSPGNGTSIVVIYNNKTQLNK